MAIIKVPQPPKSAMDPDRPISTLLKNQIRHLQEAEFRLPVRAQTNIYINAITTEGEAADYIRRVTSALHEEHAAATAKRARAKRKRVIEIAAAAADRPAQKRKSPPKSKSAQKNRKERKRGV